MVEDGDAVEDESLAAASVDLTQASQSTIATVADENLKTNGGLSEQKVENFASPQSKDATEDSK